MPDIANTVITIHYMLHVHKWQNRVELQASTVLLTGQDTVRMSFCSIHSFRQLVNMWALALSNCWLAPALASKHIQSSLQPFTSRHSFGKVSWNTSVCNRFALACITQQQILQAVHMCTEPSGIDVTRSITRGHQGSRGYKNRLCPHQAYLALTQILQI